MGPRDLLESEMRNVSMVEEWPMSKMLTKGNENVLAVCL